MKVNWKSLKVNRSHRCCRYSGTVDCAPCEGPSYKWPCYQRGPERIDPQQIWLIDKDTGAFLALGNFRTTG
jgi:hypothetical protein